MCSQLAYGCVLSTYALPNVEVKFCSDRAFSLMIRCGVISCRRGMVACSRSSICWRRGQTLPPSCCQMRCRRRWSASRCAVDCGRTTELGCAHHSIGSNVLLRCTAGARHGRTIFKMTTAACDRRCLRASHPPRHDFSSEHHDWVPQDGDDDVRAVAAEALLPVAAQLASMPATSSAALSNQLWDILLDVDELSPSTGAAAPHHTGNVSPLMVFQFASMVSGCRVDMIQRTLLRRCSDGLLQ